MKVKTMRKTFLTILLMLFVCCSLMGIACAGQENNNNVVTVEELDVLSTNISLNVGETVDVQVKNEDKTGIEFSSCDSSVATVSQTGQVRGVAEGSTFVYVKLGEDEVVCKITVLQPSNDMFLDCETVDLTVGSDKTFCLSYGGAAADVVWAVTQNEKCELLANGKNATFKATEVGSFRLTATVGEKSVSCTIRVVNQNAKRLAAPTITAANCGGTLTWNSVENAEKYALIVNEKEYFETQSTTYDLSSYSENLKNGDKISVCVAALVENRFDYLSSHYVNQTVGHEYKVARVGDISCKVYGTLRYTCQNCEHSYEESNVLVAHTWENGACSACGKQGEAISFLHDRLTWTAQTGVSAYSVWINGEKIGETDTTSFALDGYLKNAPEGNYDVEIVPFNGQLSYATARVEVVYLTAENFLTTLNSLDDVNYTYAIMTEDVKIDLNYDESACVGEGTEPEWIMSPVGKFCQSLDGNGHRITVNYNGRGKTNNAWEIFGGVFACTENAYITNVNFDVSAYLPGHVHKSFSSGGVVAYLKGNTRIENCYIKTVFELGTTTDYFKYGGIGAVAGYVRNKAETSYISNNVVDSAIYCANDMISAAGALVGSLASDVSMNANAYIVNEKLPKSDLVNEKYKEVFASWTLPSQNNWIFSDMNSFTQGYNGNCCEYRTWVSTWGYDENPRAYYNTRRLYYTKEWQGTSFDFDQTLGLTLCGKKVVLPVVDTLSIEKGTLSWTGAAETYEITVGGETVATVNGTSYAIAESILKKTATADGEFVIGVNPVGYNNEKTYQEATLKIVQLTNSNFLTQLTTNGAQKNTYFVLTEDVSLTTSYDATKTTTANGSYAENTVFAPVDEFKGALNGRGYRISVAYDGTSIANNTWEVFGGLFGYTESALIENVNFSIRAALRGHVHTNCASGAMIAMLGANTTVRNCYVKSVFNTWNDYQVTKTVVDGIGALAGKAISASTGCVIENNVVESSIIVSTNTNGHVQYEQKNSPNALVASVGVNIGINDNAYIVNRELPAVSAMVAKATYYEAFVAWEQTIGNNWLFASLADFVGGKAGLVSSYSSWTSTWAKETPSDKLWKTNAWSGTTFGYDTTLGLTLCERAVQSNL